MEATETISNVSDALTEQPVAFEIDVMPMNRWQRLSQRIGLLPKKRQFKIAPISLGNLHRISKLLLSIPVLKPERDSMLEMSYQYAVEHSDSYVEICAIAIHNGKSLPSRALIDFLKWNLTSKEIYNLITIVLNQIDVTNFIKSIISTRGLNVLGNDPGSES